MNQKPISSPDFQAWLCHMENFNRRRSVTHTTLQGIDKARFDGEKKSKHLLVAEKQAVAKDAPKAFVELVCKPLKQEAKIRSTRDSENLVSMELYRIVGIHIDLYRTTRVDTYPRLFYSKAVPILPRKVTMPVQTAGFCGLTTILLLLKSIPSTGRVQNSGVPTEHQKTPGFHLIITQQLQRLQEDNLFQNCSL